MSGCLGQSLDSVREPEDFKLIHGIGPGIESRLWNAGILKYEQLANLSPEEIYKALGDLVGLRVEKIIRQNWIGQARDLAENAASHLQPVNVEGLDEHLHYASFTVEVLLDDANDARRTRIDHIQSGTGQTWAGWDQDRLIDFFIQYSALRISIKERNPVGSIPEEPRPVERSVEETPIPVGGNLIWISDLVTIPEGYDRPYRSIPKDRVVNFGMKLNFSTSPGLRNKPIPFSATVILRKVDSGIQQTVGVSQGLLNPAEPCSIRVQSDEIPEGTYRVNAAVDLDPDPSKSSEAPVQHAQLEGGLLQVY
jgi:hypothetical protein